MRPNSIIIFLVVLSAVLCQVAEPRPAEPADQTAINEQPSNSSADYYEITFEEFKQKYQKHYSSVAEQNYRKLVFQQNLEELNLHNSNSTRRYSKKPNCFLDVSQDEFKSVYTNVRPSDKYSRNVSTEMRRKRQIVSQEKYKKHQNKENQNRTEQNVTLHQTPPKLQKQKVLTPQTNNTSESFIKPPLRNLRVNQNPLTLKKELNLTLPPVTLISNQLAVPQKKTNTTQGQNIYIDWTTYSGQVQFQGYCGACYAFATVDTLAARLAINKYSFFMSLSIQQVIDCTTNELTYGCNGGYLEGALTYIQLYGVVTQSLYPYVSGGSGFANACKMSGGPFKVSSFQPIAKGQCTIVLKQLYRGPVAAGIAGYNLRFYDSGIFDDCVKTDHLDHAIMIVGYQSSKGWRIKNSWGTDWGEKGFAWIAQGNTCWICNMTVSITV